MRYVLTIDLESWVHRDRYRDPGVRRALDGGYVQSAAMALLETLRRHEVQATFFVVAEIFDWNPQLIERIVLEGHEIGYHTHTHIRASRKFLERELALSRRFLDRFAPRGFRAPEMYLPADCLPLLQQAGFTYDSSVYGPCAIETINGLIEAPVASRPMWRGSKMGYPRPLTLGLMVREIPYGSGFFLGLLANRVQYFLHRERRSPVILFVHPWQIAKPPRQWYSIVRGLPRSLAMLPYYRNCAGVFERLLGSYPFSSCERALQDYVAGGGRPRFEERRRYRLAQARPHVSEGGEVLPGGAG